MPGGWENTSLRGDVEYDGVPGAIMDLGVCEPAAGV